MTVSKVNVGIIGLGWVGTPLKRYLEEHRGYRAGQDLHIFDIVKEKCTGDIQKADIVFVTVPTPMRADGHCDLSIIEEVVSKISGEKIIVLKSTILPGTTEYFQKKHPEHKFLFNPEFLSERKAWLDFVKPDRQIVGFTHQSLDVAHQVLSLLPRAPFMSPWGTKTYNQTRITATEAEIIKYAGNIHGARKVNWANALAKVAEKMGSSYENVRSGMAADYRIGDSHLNVDNGGYRGFGGYCFPKDLSAFRQFAKDHQLEEVADLLQSDWDFNEQLLKEQGLTIEDVSKHIGDIKQVKPDAAMPSDS
jgi:UDPglucose 6-dehydrogenase